MKQETKELIDWIKKQINIAKTNNIDPAWNGKHEAYNADYQKALAFLDSLPEIEARLTRGGYVQDKNGTPCCDGDKVKIFRKNNEPVITNLHYDSHVKTLFFLRANMILYFW